jgi:3'-phosphoadenosine 5'-phosphosulfate (PAPS) 3'-phosphatase
MVKEDGSYVTTVDFRVSDFLKVHLPGIYPAVVISEEDDPNDVARHGAETFWVIDPIDNTKGLVEHGIEQSCINVALIKNGIPIAAAIHYFSDNTTYMGTIETGVFVCNDDEIVPLVRRVPNNPPRYVAYKSNLDEMSGTMQEALSPLLATGGTIVHKEKLPLRLRSLLDGEADVYVEPRGIREWDVAAGMGLAMFLGAQLSAYNLTEEIQFNSKHLRCAGFVLEFRG